MRFPTRDDQLHYVPGLRREGQTKYGWLIPDYGLKSPIWQSGDYLRAHEVAEGKIAPADGRGARNWLHLCVSGCALAN